MSRERHGRVKEIFLAAHSLSLEARPELLEEKCGSDAELRAEVEALLLHHDSATDDSLTPPLLRGFPGSDELPQTVGNYRVLRRVGEGGMGEVYEAEQLAPVKRRVALKFIKWGMDTKEVVARFESERQALALMNHPSIASVFEAGATDEGRPYFAMEYVAGEPITDYCDRHRLSLDERLLLFVQVCDGVQHAHQKGIIHRDIKPSNILVTLLGNEPVPKIIDFGIAKATSRHLTERTVETGLGQWIGTPEYMSPEQSERTGLDIDTRTDVYSLGAVLYELLTGARPVDAAALDQMNLVGVLRALREHEPPKPSLRVKSLGKTSAGKRKLELSVLQSKLEGDLDWITMKALEKDRTHRYGSPAELAADLGRHTRDEPVLAGPPSASYRVRKFVRRHRLGVVAVSLVVASLLLGIIGTTLSLVEADRQRDAARSAQEAAEHEASKARAINQFLQEMLGSASPEGGIGRDASLLEALDAASGRIGESFQDQPDVEAAVQHTIGHIYMELAHYDEAESLLTSALQTRTSVLGREDLEVADTLTSLAQLALFWKNDNVTAEKNLREALTVRRRLLGDEHLAVADTLDKLALTLSGTAANDEAIALTRESLAIFRKATGRDNPATVEMLGVLEHYAGHYDEAKVHFVNALSLYHEQGDDQSSKVADAKSNLASLLHDLGDDASAESLFRDTLEILRTHYDEDHISVNATKANLAMTLVSQSKDDEAERLFAEAIAAYPEVLTRWRPHYAQRRVAYGVLMQRRGRYEDAEHSLRGGWDTFRELMGPGDDRTARAKQCLVNLYQVWGKPDRAEEFHD